MINPDHRGQTVVVGMSGGVDSSVAAYLLREQGYRVVGMFMKNWEEKDANGVCTSEADYQDVIRVCEKLDIPYYGVEFVREYWDQVFVHFLSEYKRGYTPNPDVLCNREIKFKTFLEKAFSVGADFLATGHYCQLSRTDGQVTLRKGADPSKDQSYFLNAVSGSALQRVLFPIGGMLKSDVRRIAREQNLPTHDKKDSTGVCFIGERDFKAFLSQYLPSKPGAFRNFDTWETVGQHSGVAYYTLGQRRGLGLGGPGDAWYVVAKDVDKNIVFVSRGDSHPALYADFLLATDLSWVSGQAPSPFPFRCRAKARYRQSDQDCVISMDESGLIRVDFDLPQRALTPGQSVVFYSGEDCLGGGVIDQVGPSYFEQGRKPLVLGSTGES